MERSKKPPINISELKREEEPSGKGPLSYVGGGEKKSIGKESGKVNYTQVVISIVLSVLLALVLITTMSASKKDALVLLDNQRELETRITTLDGGVSSEIKRIDSIVNTMGEYAKRSELTGYVSEATVSSLASQVNGLSSELAKLQSAVSAKLLESDSSLKTQISTLEAKITALATQLADANTRITNLKSEVGTNLTKGIDVTLVSITGGVRVTAQSTIDRTLAFRVTLYPAPTYYVGDAGVSINDATKAFYGLNFAPGRSCEVVLKCASPFTNTTRWEVYSVSFITSMVSLKAGVSGTWDILFSPITLCTIFVEPIQAVGIGSSGGGI